MSTGVWLWWRQVNPARAPEVVGALLDAEAPDEFVNNLILSVRSLIPVERLCAEVEQRNRLKLLSPFLEHLVSEGSQVSKAPMTHATIVQLILPPYRLAFTWICRFGLKPIKPGKNAPCQHLHMICQLPRVWQKQWWTGLTSLSASQDPHVHNALGKIIIDSQNNPDHFLTTNPFYDSLVVGKYAEKRDPHLACVAYKRGQCDDALIDCTNRCAHA